MRYTLLFIFVVISSITSGQGNFISIHQEQSQFYKKQLDYEIMNNELIHEPTDLTKQQFLRNFDHNTDIQYRIFGYHPYWIGNAYLEYRWHLLSDLCYFSYEVDPQTGNPITTHEFLTAPAVDSALANNVKVHLCVTLFSNHSTFFSSPDAQQNLIDKLIYYVQEREALGINIDFEAIPAYLSEDFMLFLADLSEQFHLEVPEGILSIAIPAVDWSGIFNISFLNDYIDLFMIMGYDYYWSGSTQAGPVSPLYGFTSEYSYCQSRTISYYLSEGMKKENMVLGIPYYARQWPTESGMIPSSTTGSGVPYKYSTIRNSSSGFYEPLYQHWDNISFSNYYAFENSGWFQCFLEQKYGLSKRYDIVKQRNLAGIGIWALGYDNGYDDLWNIIYENFTNKNTISTGDTIYDSGGPFRNYFNNESYCIYLQNSDLNSIQLNFLEFSLEDEFDSLSIFDGQSIHSPLIGYYTGNNSPQTVTSSGPTMTLFFKSDAFTPSTGWKAICSGNTNIYTNFCTLPQFRVSENPIRKNFCIIAETNFTIKADVTIRDINGKSVFLKEGVLFPKGISSIHLQTIPKLSEGIFILSLEYNDVVFNEKLIISK